MLSVLVKEGKAFVHGGVKQSLGEGKEVIIENYLIVYIRLLKTNKIGIYYTKRI